MARPEALFTAHHVTQNGNVRRELFENDYDRMVYLSLLQHHARLHCLSILGYCMMPNHVHLVVVPGRDGAINDVLHKAHGRYAEYMNTRQRASSLLWPGPYHCCPLDKEHTWSALRFVERNPVRNGIVRVPWNFHWSSARLHSVGCSDGVIDLAPWAERWTPAEWREFVTSPESDRESGEIQQSTHSGRPLGSAPFIQRLEATLAWNAQHARASRPRQTQVLRQRYSVLLSAIRGTSSPDNVSSIR